MQKKKLIFLAKKMKNEKVITWPHVTIMQLHPNQTLAKGRSNILHFVGNEKRFRGFGTVPVISFNCYLKSLRIYIGNGSFINYTILVA